MERKLLILIIILIILIIIVILLINKNSECSQNQILTQRKLNTTNCEGMT